MTQRGDKLRDQGLQLKEHKDDTVVTWCQVMQFRKQKAIASCIVQKVKWFLYIFIGLIW